MKNVYQNPPIKEVVCEFQFGQDSPWDLTVPGLVYDKIRGTFPKRSQAALITMGISANQGEIGQNIGSTPLMRFSSEDEKQIMQIGAYLLSLHHLKPYSSWEKFLPLIKESFDAYCTVASPKSIHRIGLRYINLIELANQNIKLSDYFEFRPHNGPRLPDSIGPFVLATQFPFEAARDAAKVQISSIAGAVAHDLHILLDIDYFLVRAEEVTLNDALHWLDNAHTHLEEIFEACITDQLRNTFGR